MIDFVVRVLVAGVVGLIIGLFTTNARRARMFGLVTAAAALITITSTEFYKEVAGPWFSDPGRLSAQIVSALGFIGTGLIWISSDKKSARFVSFCQLMAERYCRYVDRCWIKAYVYGSRISSTSDLLEHRNYNKMEKGGQRWLS